MPSQLSTDLLSLIVGMADRKSQVVCLRVSKALFDIAGAIVYRQVVLSGFSPPNVVFAGCDEDQSADDNVDGIVQKSTPKINLKRRLLSMIRILVIRKHECPLGDDDAELTVPLVRATLDVERVILDPDSGNWGHGGVALCRREKYQRQCLILQGLEQCRHATIHNVVRDSPYDRASLGPLTMIGPMLDHLDQLTITMPPAQCMFGFDEGEGRCRPTVEDQARILRNATRNVKSIRIIIISDLSTGLSDKQPSVMARSLLKYLGVLIAGHTATFDVIVCGYAFSLSGDPSDFDAGIFRNDLLVEIGKYGSGTMDNAGIAAEIGGLVGNRSSLGLIGNICDYFDAMGSAPTELSPGWAKSFRHLHQLHLDWNGMEDDA